MVRSWVIAFEDRDNIMCGSVIIVSPWKYMFQVNVFMDLHCEPSWIRTDIHEEEGK